MTDITAFPSHGAMGEVVQEGMTLRDYFAAKAMVYVAGTAELDHVGPAELAAACFEHADAMLYARMDFVVRQDIAAVERQLEAAIARSDRAMAALRALHKVCADTNDGLEDDPANREAYLGAMSIAEALIEDDETIPF